MTVRCDLANTPVRGAVLPLQEVTQDSQLLPENHTAQAFHVDVGRTGDLPTRAERTFEAAAVRDLETGSYRVVLEGYKASMEEGSSDSRRRCWDL